MIFLFAVGSGCMCISQQRPRSRVYDLTKQLVAVTQRREEDLPTVEKLVAAGADVRGYFVRDEDGVAVELSAFQYACMKKHWRIVDYLLDHGARVNPKIEGGRTYYYTPLSCAAGHSLALVRRMVARGADVNSNRDYHCYTPLMSAVYSKKISIIRYLLAKHAKVNAVCQEGQTVLDQTNLMSDRVWRRRIRKILLQHHARTFEHLHKRYPALLNNGPFYWPPPVVPER